MYFPTRFKGYRNKITKTNPNLEVIFTVNDDKTTSANIKLYI